MTQREELMRIAEEVARAEGVELYWLEYQQAPGRWRLMVMIEKEGGVTLGDCERVSRALEGPFDERIDHSYELEVSSPGLDRPLYTEKHFQRAIGQRVKVKTYAPIQGERVWSGVLVESRQGTVRLQTASGPLEIPLAQLAAARVSPEFDLS
jgi:ribosome maturation factor RimP